MIKDNHLSQLKWSLIYVFVYHLHLKCIHILKVDMGFEMFFFFRVSTLPLSTLSTKERIVGTLFDRPFEYEFTNVYFVLHLLLHYGLILSRFIHLHKMQWIDYHQKSRFILTHKIKLTNEMSQHWLLITYSRYSL